MRQRLDRAGRGPDPPDGSLPPATRPVRRRCGPFSYVAGILDRSAALPAGLAPRRRGLEGGDVASARSRWPPPVSPYRPDLVECWIFRVPPGGEPEFLLIRRAPGRIFPGCGSA